MRHRHLRKRLLLAHKKFQENEVCVREHVLKGSPSAAQWGLGRHQHCARKVPRAFAPADLSGDTCVCHMGGVPGISGLV